jgi:hypothetical protein
VKKNCVWLSIIAAATLTFVVVAVVGIRYLINGIWLKVEVDMPLDTIEEDCSTTVGESSEEIEPDGVSPAGDDENE